MGMRIITNNVNSWQLWSSITDSITDEFTSEQDLKEFLAKEAIYSGKLKAIEILMAYPFQYMVNDKIIIGENNSGYNGFCEYHKWYEKMAGSTTNYTDYYQKIDDKLNELMPDNKKI